MTHEQYAHDYKQQQFDIGIPAVESIIELEQPSGMTRARIGAFIAKYGISGGLTEEVTSDLWVIHNLWEEEL